MATMIASLNDTGGDVSDPQTAKLKLILQVVNILVLTCLMISMGTTIDLKDFKETVSMRVEIHNSLNSGLSPSLGVFL